ncbi:hypothetical protein BCN12_28000, partial [Salmonella enterica]|nr:hypothetical protein [Salmonella enterica]EAO7619143.1 hypothetical protein [Salmonella enterica]
PVTLSAVKSITLSAMTSSNMTIIMFITVTRIGRFFKTPTGCSSENIQAHKIETDYNNILKM